MNAKCNRPNLMGKNLYWIAINGSSCAFYSLPLTWPFEVVPTPEILIGFPTAKEAKENQHYNLTAPISCVIMRSKELAKRKDVFIIRVSNPKPPTDGPTMWVQQKAAVGNN